jgi:hypothetical protein
MRSPFGRRAPTVATIPRARGKVERPGPGHRYAVRRSEHQLDPGLADSGPAGPGADVGNVSAATPHLHSGALGTIASTCLLKWLDQVGLQLISKRRIIKLREDDTVINVGQDRPVVPVRVNAMVHEVRDFVEGTHTALPSRRLGRHQPTRWHQLELSALCRRGAWIRPDLRPRAARPMAAPALARAGGPGPR